MASHIHGEKRAATATTTPIEEARIPQNPLPSEIMMKIAGFLDPLTAAEFKAANSDCRSYVQKATFPNFKQSFKTLLTSLTPYLTPDQTASLHAKLAVLEQAARQTMGLPLGAQLPVDTKKARQDLRLALIECLTQSAPHGPVLAGITEAIDHVHARTDLSNDEKASIYRDQIRRILDPMPLWEPIPESLKILIETIVTQKIEIALETQDFDFGMGLALTLDGESKKLLIRSVMEASIKYYGEYHSAVSLLCNTRLDAETNHNIVASILLDRIDQSKGTFSEQWSQAIKSCFPRAATFRFQLDHTQLNKALIRLLINRKEFQKALDIGIIEIEKIQSTFALSSQPDLFLEQNLYTDVFPTPLHPAILTLLETKIEDALSKQDLYCALDLTLKFRVYHPFMLNDDDLINKILTKGLEIGRAQGSYTQVIEVLNRLPTTYKHMHQDAKARIILDQCDQLQEGSFQQKWKESINLCYPNSSEDEIIELTGHAYELLDQTMKFKDRIDLLSIFPKDTEFEKIQNILLLKIIPEPLPFSIRLGMSFIIFDRVMGPGLLEELEMPDIDADTKASLLNLKKLWLEYMDNSEKIGDELKEDLTLSLLNVFLTSGLDAAKAFAEQQELTDEAQLAVESLFRLLELA